MNRPDGDLHQPVFLLSERASTSRADYILKAGLAQDPEKLNLYKRVMSDPKRAVNEPILRPYAGDILAKLLKILMSDTVIWNRTKVILSRDKKSVRGLREDVSDSGLRALVDKAVDSETPLEIVLEVYSRGAEIGGESGGFSRVNSFVAGGRALQMDADLVTERAPEQKTKSRTLSTVKRVLREKNQ